MNEQAHAPVVVIGIGNPMRCDDGIGPAVLEQLERSSLDCDLVQLDGEPTSVIEAWRDRRLAIVVDAICAGAAPGTVHERTIDDLGDLDQAPTLASSHAAGIAEALAYGRAFDRLPERLHVLGIEPRSLDHGLGLSPDVAASIPTLVTRIRALAKRGGA